MPDSLPPFPSSNIPTTTHLSALLKDVAVALVVVAGRARLGVHVRHVEGHLVQLEGGPARRALGVARLLAAQLAGLGLRVVGALRALARLEAVRQADGAGALLEWMEGKNVRINHIYAAVALCNVHRVRTDEELRRRRNKRPEREGDGGRGLRGTARSAISISCPAICSCNQRWNEQRDDENGEGERNALKFREWWGTLLGQFPFPRFVRSFVRSFVLSFVRPCLPRSFRSIRLSN